MLSSKMMNISFGLDSVNIGFLANKTEASKTLPLVISPRWESSLEFLIEWCQQNRSFLDESLIKYGAILVRGFEINNAKDMQDAVQAFQPKLHNVYRGTSPRNALEGTEYVFSAAEVPTNYPIAQHLEMSFLDAPPKQLYFCCLKPSMSTGGETAICDFAKVFDDLPEDLKQKFLDKGIRYTRTHKKVGTYFTYDVGDMLGWPELFKTNDKAEVEKICKAEGTPCTWKDDDKFVSITYSPAFQLHPMTNQLVWFNHAQVFHWTTFPRELWFAFQRTKEWRLFFQFCLVGLFCLIKYGLLGYKMSLTADFGDGTPITAEEIHTVRKAIHKNMVFSRWEKGDLMMIDNFRVSHGRQPTYDSGRKIAVAWCEPQVKTNAVTSIHPVEFSMENPQERTPESTLTKEESECLKEQVREGTGAKNGAGNPQLIMDQALEAAYKKKIAADQQRIRRHHSIADSSFWTEQQVELSQTEQQGHRRSKSIAVSSLW